MKEKVISILEEKIDEYDIRDLEHEEIEYEGKKFIFHAEYVKGGYEGAGEEHYIILKVTHEGKDTFWKIPGYYASYAGSELEIGNTFQVTPVQKTYTDYEKI